MFTPPFFEEWRGRWTTSWNIITNEGVSGPEFVQLFLQDVHLRKQFMEFLQFWDQHRGSFSRISAAGWSFSYAPANRSWSWPLQNPGFGAPMSRICETFSQIASPRPFVWTRVINLSQQSNWFAYLEIIHVSDQLICVERLTRWAQISTSSSSSSSSSSPSSSPSSSSSSLANHTNEAAILLGMEHWCRLDGCRFICNSTLH